MRPNYEDMRDFQYGEENPGYQRPIAYIPEYDGEERDPEIEAMVADIYAHDNRKRQEGNLHTENARLRALLEENGIDPDGD